MGFAGVEARDRGTDADPRRHCRQRRRPSQRRGARRAGSRARASSCFDGRRAPVLLGAAGASPSGSSTSSSDERAHHRQDHPRPRPDHPGRIAIDERGRTWTYAELDARSDELARRLAHGRPCLDAHRQLGRARRPDVRVREGGRDPAPDLVAARPGGGRVPARRRRAGRASWSRTNTASSVRPRSSSRA